MRIINVLVLSFLTIVFAGCTSVTDLKTDISESLFGRPLSDPPSPLNDFKPTAKANVLWSAQLGENGDYDLSPVVDNGSVYAASSAGDVYKINLTNGKQIWRVNAGETISGGVGVGSDLVLVGSTRGNVIAFDLNGKMLWKSKVSSEILSAPKIDYSTVVVRCGDSRIYGLNAADGSRKWVYERENPPLSLRSSAGVALDGGAAYAGFAGGKLVALRVDDGKVIWEASVAQPKGTTEIERIADITSLPVVDGSLVYAVAFQGRVAAIERSTGHLAWNRDISSYTGLTSDAAKVFISHAMSAVYALDFATGKTYWRQGDLRHRQITAPLALDKYIVIGDVEGYVHFLNREDGLFAARIQVEESPVMPLMTSIGSSGLLLQTRKGGLYAINVK